MFAKLYSFCRATVMILAICIAILLLFANYCYQVEVSYDEAEFVTVFRNLLKNSVLMILTLLFVCFFALIQKYIWRMNPSHLFTVLSFCYVFFAAYLILNSTNVIRADASCTYTCALQVKNGDYSMFQPKEYMNIYPHQIGLMLFDLLIVTISENPSFLFFINLFLVLGINFFTWQTSKLLWEDTKIHLLTILLSFMFLPQLFFIMFAYGQIPGLFFLSVSIYHAIRYIRSYRISSLLWLIVSLSASVLVRRNYLIGACAICIYLLMEFLKKRNYRLIVTVAALAVSLLLSGKAVISFFETKAETDLQRGCPTVLWVAMGTDVDNRVRCSGWYDNSSFQIYMKADADPEAAKEQGWEKLRQNMEKAWNRPADTFRFLKEKIASQWCDPLYQSIWSGPMLPGVQQTYTAVLQSLYSGGTVENLLGMYCKGLSFLLWGSYAAYLLTSGKKENGWEIAALFLMGGFIFHIFWEGKSQYIYPYVFCLIPFCARALASGLCKGFRRRALD